MEVQYKKYVKVICTLNVGDRAIIDGWGYQFDGKEVVIKDIKAAIGECESGFLIKVTGYNNWIDSNWVTAVPAARLE